MKIKWLGHAAFLFTAADGTKVLTDPYVPGAYDGAVGYGKIQETVDVVTVSHSHPDHSGAGGLPGSPLVISEPGERSVKGIKVFGLATFHDRSQGKERGKNIVFVYEVDGLRLVHLGDLGHIPDRATVQALGQVDVLLVPVGGVFTIDAREAQEVVRLLKPRVVIPMHYKTQRLGFQIAGVDEFLKLCPEVRRIGSSEVEVLPATLPTGTETWVLNPAR